MIQHGLFLFVQIGHMQYMPAVVPSTNWTVSMFSSCRQWNNTTNHNWFLSYPFLTTVNPTATWSSTICDTAGDIQVNINTYDSSSFSKFLKPKVSGFETWQGFLAVFSVLSGKLSCTSGEISPTRCNNCLFYSQWLYSTCFGWQSLQEAWRRTTRQRLPTTPQQ